MMFHFVSAKRAVNAPVLVHQSAYQPVPQAPLLKCCSTAKQKWLEALPPFLLQEPAVPKQHLLGRHTWFSPWGHTGAAHRDISELSSRAEKNEQVAAQRYVQIQENETHWGWQSLCWGLFTLSIKKVTITKRAWQQILIYILKGKSWIWKQKINTSNGFLCCTFL